MGLDEIGSASGGLCVTAYCLELGNLLLKLGNAHLSLPQGGGLLGNDGLLLPDEGKQFLVGLGSRSLHSSLYERTDAKY
jgi:hypothetical protein